jgi:hypothetical protein
LRSGDLMNRRQFSGTTRCSLPRCKFQTDRDDRSFGKLHLGLPAEGSTVQERMATWSTVRSHVERNT